ncbi:MAG: hypothetical protein EXS46_02540 [Candidatus Taylorbacteria bacterium]|nr:hypothetical protein [Candidatus Taylorbacteria bacterium]
MIELTTSALVLLSIFFGTPAVSAEVNNSKAPVVQTYTKNDPSIVDGVALIAPTDYNNSVENEVREYFEDTPILAEIAKCESQFRHVGKSGEIIRGMVNDDDIGVMQINEYYHSSEADKLRINLKTLSGNMNYARILYGKFGTNPWQSSSTCWNRYVSIVRN